MNEFSEETLRRQLHGTVDAEFTVQTIHPMSGAAVARREIRDIYSRRLEHARGLAPARPDLVTLCQSVLTAIETVTEDDALFSWHIVSGSGHLCGLSTPARIVFTIPYDDSVA